MPAAATVDEHGLHASQVPANGPGGRLLKEDVLAFVQNQKSTSSPAPLVPPSDAETGLVTVDNDLRGEEIKPLSMLRRTIAARLVEAQQTAALLTTFNEIDMDPVMQIRKKYKDQFLTAWCQTVSAYLQKRGTARYPARTRIRVTMLFTGTTGHWRHGGGYGLVVRVLRNVERLCVAMLNSPLKFCRGAENRLQPADPLVVPSPW